jgi:hypothetical protein
MVLATDVAKFILIAAEKGGIYNLTDGYHPTFNELSKNIASKMGKSYVPNLPKYFAYLLAKFGDHLGNNFPINSFLPIFSPRQHAHVKCSRQGLRDDLDHPHAAVPDLDQPFRVCCGEVGAGIFAWIIKPFHYSFCPLGCYSPGSLAGD